MNCPVCKSGFDPRVFYSIPVQYCSGCGGLLVEGKEMGRLLQNCLKRLEITCESSTKERPKVAAILDKTPSRTCPNCRRQMRRLNYAYDSNVMVDKCQFCGCMFLEKGEIDSIARYLKCSWNVWLDFKAKSKKIDEIYRQAQREDAKRAMKEALGEVAKESAAALVMFLLSRSLSR